MLTRPTKGQVFLGIAQQLAQLSTCDRAQVGAVIVRQGRAISWGYNGAPPGLPHCSENNHGWNSWIHTETEGCQNTTHAEANALAFAARQGISTDGATLYLTLSPCAVCARLIIAAGIRQVWWIEDYRDHEGTLLLAQGKVMGGKYA